MDIGAPIIGMHQDEIKRMAEEHGAVILTDPDEIEAFKKRRDKEFHDEIEENVFQKHMRFFDAISLYSGDEKLRFTFNDWDPTKQEDVNTAKDIGNQCFTLAKEMLTDNFNVMLVGTPGVGKTSLALAMLEAVHAKRKTTMFVSTMALSLLLTERFDNREAQQKLDRIISAMKKVDVLLLDDFGTEAGMKAEGGFKPVRKDLQEYFFNIADARLATIKDDDDNKHRIKSTIITTNNTMGQLKQMYNEKLLSRLIPHDVDKTVVFKNMVDIR